MVLWTLALFLGLEGLTLAMSFSLSSWGIRPACLGRQRFGHGLVSRCLLNIAKRSLLRLMLSCIGLASKHVAG
jgi:hypothetical protein